MGKIRIPRLVKPHLMDAVIIVECGKCQEEYAFPDYDAIKRNGFNRQEVEKLCKSLSTCDTDLTYLEHQQMCG